MPRFYWEKLVRDKVVRHSEIDPKVIDIVYKELDNESYHHELLRKVNEEAQEIPFDDGGSGDGLKELADLQAVVDALRIAKGYSVEQLREAMVRKETKKGGFALRHYVAHVDLADDSEWIEVFRAQPEKYREEKL